MKALIIGGTGLISRGIVKHLLARGAEVTMYNRAQRDNPLPPDVKLVTGDRSRRSEFESTFSGSRFDVVIDMICFRPEDAESDVRAFGGRCEQLQLCSRVPDRPTSMGIETGTWKTRVVQALQEWVPVVFFSSGTVGSATA